MAGLNIVKSVESLNFSVEGTISSQALTLGQNAEYCVPFMTQYMSSDMEGYQDRYFLDATITGTIPYLDVSRVSSNSICYVQAYMVEFNPDEVKVLSGSFSLSGISTTVTVSGIDTSKAMIVCRYNSSESSRGLDAHAVRYRFLTTVSGFTDIEFTRGTAGGIINGHYYIVEDLCDNFNVYHTTSNMSSVASIYSESPSPHNLNNTMVMCSFYYNDSDENPEHNCVLTHCRTDMGIWLQRHGAGSIIYSALQEIRFNVPDSVRMVQRNHIYMGNGTNTTDWTMEDGYHVNEDFSMVHNPTLIGTNYFYYGGADYYECQYFRYHFVDNDTVRAIRGQDSYEVYYSFEIIDWNGYSIREGMAPIPKISELKSIDSMVKSIEHIDISFTGHWYEYVLTKGQDVNNCVPFMTFKCSGNTAQSMLIDAYFLAPDILRFAVFGSGSVKDIKGSIVEFEPDQVRVQQGSFYDSGTTAYVTISEVNLSKAALKLYWQTSFDSYIEENSTVRGRFTTASGLEFYRDGSNGIMSGHYYIFEALDDQFYVQSGLTNMSYVNWATSDLLFEAFRHRSFCLFSYAYTDTDPNPENAMVYGHSISRREISFGRASSNQNILLSWYVVTLKALPNTIFVQRRSSSISNGAVSVTNTLLHEVNPETSIVFHPSPISNGKYENGTASYGNRALSTLELTSSGIITINRYSTENNAHFLYQVIDFAGITTYSGEQLSVSDDSLIKSLESIYFNHDEDYHIISPSKGQDLKNCVPFMTSSTNNTGGYIYRSRPEIFFEDGMIHLKTYSDYGTRYISLFLVEFNPLRVRVQSGHYYLMDSISTTVNIEEVDTSKSFLIHNWHSNTSSQSWSHHLIRGTMSSTQLIFDRGTASGDIYGTWWVVESLDDAFTVRSNNISYSSSVGNVSFDVPYRYGALDNSILICSYKKDTNTDPNPEHSAVRNYISTYSPNIMAYSNKFSSSTYVYISMYLITFNENESVYVQHRNQVDILDGEWSKTYSINKVDVDRSMVFSPTSYSNARYDYSSVPSSERAFHKYDIINDGTQIYCSTISSPNNSYSSYQVVQWPSPKNRCIDGYITEKNIPVGRVVRLYDRSTGSLLYSSTSNSNNGYYSLFTAISGTCYVVALDDDAGESYNAIISDKLVPEIM